MPIIDVFTLVCLVETGFKDGRVSAEVLQSGSGGFFLGLLLIFTAPLRIPQVLKGWMGGGADLHIIFTANVLQLRGSEATRSGRKTKNKTRVMVASHPSFNFARESCPQTVECD